MRTGLGTASKAQSISIKKSSRRSEPSGPPWRPRCAATARRRRGGNITQLRVAAQRRSRGVVETRRRESLYSGGFLHPDDAILPADGRPAVLQELGRPVRRAAPSRAAPGRLHRVGRGLRLLSRLLSPLPARPLMVGYRRLSL